MGYIIPIGKYTLSHDLQAKVWPLYCCILGCHSHVLQWYSQEKEFVLTKHRWCHMLPQNVQGLSRLVLQLLNSHCKPFVAKHWKSVNYPGHPLTVVPSSKLKIYQKFLSNIWTTMVSLQFYNYATWFYSALRLVLWILQGAEISQTQPTTTQIAVMGSLG